MEITVKMRNNYNGIYLNILVLLMVLLSSCKKTPDDEPWVPPPPPPTQHSYVWSAIADSAQASIPAFYSPSGNFYQASNVSSAWVQYWPSAHTLDVLTDAYLRSSSKAAIKAQMDKLLEGMYKMNGNTWLNFYYDDMQWMAISSLRAYKATGDSKFRQIYEILWPDIKNGWSSDLGGGIWWRKDNPSKNTCSNMPAALFAARLYQETKNPDDLEWAKKIYTWQKNTLYDGSGWLLDNITKDGVKNLQWKFTYNQGTFAGAALELYKITSEAAYLNDAMSAVDYAINSGFLTSGGILKDEGGGDGGLFKGILVRYMTRMILEGNLPPNKKKAYADFLLANGKSLWDKGTLKGNPTLFNSNWAGKPGPSVDFTIQLSGIMLMEALAELSAAKII